MAVVIVSFRQRGDKDREGGKTSKERGDRHRVGRERRRKSKDPCSLQRFSRNDGLLLSLQPLHLQHRVQAAIGMLIRSSNPIRPGEVLSVINGEIQMMQGVMRGPVDHVLQPVSGNHIRIVNEHRPNVHPDEQREVQVFLYREEVGEDVVGEGLDVSVDRVESICGERGGDDPLVVRFVDVLVDERVVSQPVDPVNAVIREEQKPMNQIQIRERRARYEGQVHAHWDREEEPGPTMLINIAIQLGIPQNLSLEPRNGQQRHHRETLQAHRDLLPHLIL